MFGERKQKLPEFLTEEEQKQILSIPNKRYWTGERNYLILKYFLGTGLRLSELLDLEWKDINLMSGQIMVREGKGKKDRSVWIGEEEIELTQRWKQRQIEKVGKVTNIFTTDKGTRITNRYIQYMVKRYTEKAGINKDITPHKLRHTFATDMIKTNNIRMVQKALGHSFLATTMIYTHVQDNELEKAMKNLRK